MNSAHRLLQLTAAFAGVKGEIAMHSAWIKIFSITGDEAEGESAGAMQTALYEVKLWEQQLEEMGVPKELYSHAVKDLRRAFNPTNAGNAVGSTMGGALGAPTQHALKWSSWVLREFDEKDLSSDDRDALDSALTALEEQLADPSVPLAVQRALDRQARSLRLAIRLHKIGGAEPLREAVRRAIGELVTIPPRVRSAPEAKSAIEKAVALAKTAGEICEKLSATIEVAKTGFSITEALKPLLGYTP